MVAHAPTDPTPTDARAIAAGLLGAGAALGLLLVARGGGSPGILEVVADSLIRAIPPALFDWGVKSLGPMAKQVLFIGVAIGIPAAGALMAWLLGRLRWIGHGPWIRDASVAAATAVLSGLLLVLPVAGAGIAGAELVSDRAAVLGPFLAASVAYGAVVSAWLTRLPGRPMALNAPRWTEQPESRGDARDDRVSRRALLVYAAAAVGIAGWSAAVLTVGARLRGASRTALPGEIDLPGVDGFGYQRAVVPVPQFYFVSKDWVPMDVDGPSWRLRVGGMVEEPRAWTLGELQGLPRHEAYRTIQCISAESITRTTLIGNQRWAGVRVRDVVAASRPSPDARFLIWRCADGYHESTDLETAFADDTWLVDEMGPPGTPLSPEHGFPLRLLVAGRYGMAQPKHITDLVVQADDEPGWWVRAGWDTTAPVRTYCRIDLPVADGISDAVLAGTRFTAYGVASSGDRGISAVQTSIDGGATWRDAEMEPLGGPIGRLTWVRWRAQVTLDQPGTLLFMARAADGSGRWQEDAIEEPFPRGASGYPRVPMRVYPSLDAAR